MIVVIGDFIQQGVTHNDFSLTGSFLAIVTLAFWTLAMSWATYLLPRLETLLYGPPQVTIRDGTIMEANLRRDRITRAGSKRKCGSQEPDF